MQDVYRFGPYTFQPESGLLTTPVSTTTLREKTARVLSLLLDSEGRCLSREEMLTEAWDGDAVTDHVLTQAISEIRKALSDGGRQPGYIRTLPKKGYQWIHAAPVTEKEEPSLPLPLTDPTANPAASSATVSIKRKPYALWLFPIAALIVFGLFLLPREETSTESLVTRPVRVAIMPFANDTGQLAHDWVQLGLMEMVVTHLQDDRGPRLTPVSEILAFWSSRPRPVDRVEANRWRRDALAFFDADYLLEVRIAAADPKDALPYRAEFELTPVDGKPGLRSWAITKPFDTILLATRFLNEKIRPEHPFPETDALLADRPFAREAYALGLQAASDGDWERAEQFFRTCTVHAPDFLLAKARLVIALLRRGELEQGFALLDGLRDDPRLDDQFLAKTITLKYLALAARRKGDFDTAECYLFEALDIPQNKAATSDRANLADSMGQLYEAWGRYEAAYRWFGEAVILAESDGAPCLRANASMNLANVEIARGHTDQANTMYMLALRIYEDLGGERQIASALNNLAQVHVHRGDLATAQQFCLQILDLHRTNNDRLSEAIVLHNLSFLAREQELWQDAEQYIQLALVINTELGNTLGQSRNHLEMARMAKILGDQTLADKHYDLAYGFAETMQHMQIMKTITDERSSGLAASSP